MFFSSSDEKKNFSFVSVAVHKFRSPLTVLRGYLEMLGEERYGPLSKEQRNLVEDMQKATMRLLSMVEDMRDVSSIATDSMVLRPEAVHVEEIVVAVIEEFREYMQNYRITMRYTPPTVPLPLVIVDKERIRQALSALVDNAVRYSRAITGEDSWIALEVGVKGKDVVVNVQDNGIGIPAKDQKYIFTKFFRASNAQPFSSAGTGLGLFIAQAIVKKSGGTITFRSEENKGTTFTVSLPAAG